MEDRFRRATERIDAAHAEDPTTCLEEGEPVPYELHYAKKMSHYLAQRAPDASPTLRLAVRSQHLKRWEVPRDSFPMTKLGYHSWRTFLKKRQAEIASQICTDCGLSDDEIKRVTHLVRKEDLNNDVETQILEDVACLVFLDDQFETFEQKHEAGKIISILQKTWAKMTEQGHDLALQIPMTSRCKEIVTSALEG